VAVSSDGRTAVVTNRGSQLSGNSICVIDLYASNIVRTIELEVFGTPVRVKVRERPAYGGAAPFGERDLAAEHDDLVLAARAGGVTLREARARVVAAALEHLA